MKATAEHKRMAALIIAAVKRIKAIRAKQRKRKPH
jgi:hypothetical protein